MSDQTPHPQSEQTLPPEPDAAPVMLDPVPPATKPPLSGRSVLRPLWVAVAVLALLLVVGGVALWRDGQDRGEQLDALQNRLNDAEAQLGKLAGLPPPPDIAPLQRSVAALQGQVAALGNKPPPDIAPLQQSVAALQGQVTALANKPPPQAALDEASRQQLAALSGRIDGIAARQDQLGTAEQADVAAVNGQLGELGNKVDTLGTQADASTKASSAVTALSAKEARTAQLQAAAAALAAGRPVGAIADAPPALGKFATQAPPTEASLRLSFEAAADSARDAGQPTPDSMPFLQRMLQRAESSVTVKAGNTLVVGDTLSNTLDRARKLLGAGDLAGAVTALGGLAGPAAQAMAPWREQAQSLLDARAALISAAGH